MGRKDRDQGRAGVARGERVADGFGAPVGCHADDDPGVTPAAGNEAAGFVDASRGAGVPPLGTEPGCGPRRGPTVGVDDDHPPPMPAPLPPTRHPLGRAVRGRRRERGTRGRREVGAHGESRG